MTSCHAWYHTSLAIADNCLHMASALWWLTEVNSMIDYPLPFCHHRVPANCKQLHAHSQSRVRDESHMTYKCIDTIVTPVHCCSSDYSGQASAYSCLQIAQHLYWITDTGLTGAWTALVAPPIAVVGVMQVQPADNSLHMPIGIMWDHRTDKCINEFDRPLLPALSSHGFSRCSCLYTTRALLSKARDRSEECTSSITCWTAGQYAAGRNLAGDFQKEISDLVPPPQRVGCV